MSTRISNDDDSAISERRERRESQKEGEKKEREKEKEKSKLAKPHWRAVNRQTRER